MMVFKKSFNFKTQIIFLLFFSLILRSAFFFTEYLSDDEASYIIMAQSIIDGNFIYDTFKEAKPPIAFFPFYFSILFFGKNIFFIRFLSFLIIFFISFLILLISSKILKKFTLLPSILFILYSSLLVDGGLSLETHHVSLIFFLISLIFFNKNFFLVGIFLSLAFFTRQNYAITTFFICIFYLFFFNKNFKEKMYDCLKVASGFFLVFLIIIIPFYIYKKLDLFFINIFLAPMQLAGHNNLIVSTIYLIGRSLNLYYLEYKIIPSFIFFVSSFFGFFIMQNFKKKKPKENRESFNFFSIINFYFYSALLSVIFTNIAHNQHLLQISPFLCIFSVFFILKILENKSVNYLVFFLIIFIVFSTLQFTRWDRNEYYIISKYYDDLRKFLIKNIKNSDNIFIYDLPNILYWSLGKYPPVPFAHQTTLIKNDYLHVLDDNNHNSSFYLNKIFNDKKVNYLILGNKISHYKEYFDLNTGSNININQYKLLKTYGPYFEYTRLFRERYTISKHEYNIYIYELIQ